MSKVILGHIAGLCAFLAAAMAVRAAIHRATGGKSRPGKAPSSGWLRFALMLAICLSGITAFEAVNAAVLANGSLAAALHAIVARLPNTVMVSLAVAFVEGAFGAGATSKPTSPEA